MAKFAHTLIILLLVLLGITVTVPIIYTLVSGSQPPGNVVRLPLEPTGYVLCPDQVRCVVWSGYHYREPMQYYQCGDKSEGFAYQDEHICDNRELKHNGDID